MGSTNVQSSSFSNINNSKSIFFNSNSYAVYKKLFDPIIPDKIYIDLNKKNLGIYANHIYEIEKDKSLNIHPRNKKYFSGNISFKKNNKFRVHLLQGTTGSGKTIVYFNAIKKKLNEGYQSLILLPEIGLTKEFEKNFISFFVLNQLFGIHQLQRKIKR